MWPRLLPLINCPRGSCGTLLIRGGNKIEEGSQKQVNKHVTACYCVLQYYCELLIYHLAMMDVAQMSALLNGILDSLSDLGYEGPLMGDGALRTAAQEGLRSPKFIELVHLVCTDLKTTLNLDESVYMSLRH